MPCREPEQCTTPQVFLSDASGGVSAGVYFRRLLVCTQLDERDVLLRTSVLALNMTSK